MAFDIHLTSIMTGASHYQLNAWSRSGMLTPELDYEGHRMWSHRDLVAIRTFVYLRSRRVSVQKIQRALSNMSSEFMRMYDHPGEYLFQEEGGDIIIAPTSNAAAVVSALRVPGQQRFATFADVFGEFIRRIHRKESTVVDFRRPRAHVVCEVDVLGGYPVAQGTRVPFDIIATSIADEDGYRVDDIAEMFPAVTVAAARDAISLYNATYPKKAVAA